jgi:hypothetical protein
LASCKKSTYEIIEVSENSTIESSSNETNTSEDNDTIISDDNVTSTSNDIDSNVYIYKFTNKSNGKITWIAWWDYFNEISLMSKTINLSDYGINGTVKVTNLVPNYESGLNLLESGKSYTDSLYTRLINQTLTLEKTPVIIEENRNYQKIEYPEYDSPFGLLRPVAVDNKLMNQLNSSEEDYINWKKESISELNIQYGRENNLLRWELHEPSLGDDYIWTSNNPGLNTDDRLTVIKSNTNSNFKMMLGFNAERNGSVAYIGNDSEMEDNLQMFIQTSVERYDGDGVNDFDSSISIKYWQVDNEPFIGDTWIVDKGGTTKTYARYVELLNESVKKADPKAMVVLGAEMSPKDGKGTITDNMREVIEYLKNKNAFDIVDIHYWGEASNYKMELAAEIRKTLDENGYSYVKIWSCENNTYVNEPAGHSSQTEEQQAISLVKRYVYNFSHDVEKIFLTHLVDFSCFAGRCDGLFDNIGIISDGENSGETTATAGVKRLSYYSQVLLAQSIYGTDLTDIAIIHEPKSDLD